VSNNVARNVSKANLEGARQVTIPPRPLYIHELGGFEGFWVL
jgi:hypothetical protein